MFFAAEVRASIDGERGKKRAKAIGRFGGGASGGGGVVGSGDSARGGWLGRGEEVQTGGGSGAWVCAAAATAAAAAATIELSEATHSESDECETDIDACWSDDIDDIGLDAVSGGLVGLDDEGLHDALDVLTSIDARLAQADALASVHDDDDVLTFLDDFVDEKSVAERSSASPRVSMREGANDRSTSSMFW